MRTFSHILMTGVLHTRLKRRQIHVHAKAIMLGSFLPDLPLILLTLGYVIYYGLITPIPDDQGFWSLYDGLYFQNPFWIASHNLLHAPLLVAGALGVGAYARQRDWAWGLPLFWFAIACGLHALIDILTHNNDGPLLWFPLNWEYRFQSPVSYWDPEHYGRLFTFVEYTLDLLMVAYFAIRWVHIPRFKRQTL